MTVICVPCENEFESVTKEVLGEIYWCRKCGTEISFDWDKDNVSINNGKHDIR